jgi:hypothetical protein
MLSVSIVLTNPSDTPAYDVAVDFLIPEGLDVSATNLSSGGECPSGCYAGRTVSWALPRLDPGAYQVFSFFPVVDRGAASGDVLALDVAVYATDSPEVHTRSTIDIIETRVLDLRVDASSKPSRPGSEVVYTVHYGNRGDVSLTGVDVDLDLPEGVSIRSATDGGVESSPGVTHWRIAPLRPGEVGLLQATAVLGENVELGTHLIAESEATADNGESARATAHSFVGNSPIDLAVQVASEPRSFGSVALVVSNPTMETVYDVAVESVIPPSIDVSGDSFSPGGECPEGCYSGRVVRWSFPSLAPQEVTTLFWQPIARSGTLDASVHTFEARAYGSNVLSPSVASTSVAFSEDSPLRLWVGERQDPATPGSNLTYSLRYSNVSNVSRPIANLTFTLPRGASFAAASPGGTFNGSDRIDWSLGPLAPGQTGTAEVTVQLASTLPQGSFVRAQAELDDEAGERAYAFAQTSMRSIDLDLSITAQSDLAPRNAQLPITVELRNTSSAPLLDAVVNMVIPPGVRVSTNNLSRGGTCPSGCYVGRTASWSFARLEPSEPVQLTMIPTVTAAIGEIIPFEVHVYSNGQSPVTSAVSVSVQ